MKLQNSTKNSTSILKFSNWRLFYEIQALKSACFYCRLQTLLWHFVSTRSHLIWKTFSIHLLKDPQQGFHLEPPWATWSPDLDCFPFFVPHETLFFEFFRFQKGGPVFIMSFWQLFKTSPHPYLFVWRRRTNMVRSLKNVTCKCSLSPMEDEYSKSHMKCQTDGCFRLGWP